MPDIKKYLNRDGLEEYNSMLPHSSAEMQTYVNDWLDDHPEATTTVQDGAITEPKLADKSVSFRTLADDIVHMLKGAILTGNLSGNVLSAYDAYYAPPVALTVEGKSTQDGTPTPDAPVEIVSVEQVTIHASADGTTDAANWPVLIQLTQPLRSLPDGTKDTLALSYLRPSTREGWAWYSRELTKVVGEADLGALVFAKYGPSLNNHYSYGSDTISALIVGAPNNTTIANVLSPSYRTDTYNNTYGKGIESIAVSNTGRVLVYNTEFDSSDKTANEFKTAMSGVILLYQRKTPVTTNLDPIELPFTAAPDFTIWSDPSTGLQMEYVRDANIVIQNIEQAIADQ